MEPIIQLWTEHDIPNIIQQNYSQQNTSIIHYRKRITTTPCNHFYHVSQRHLWRNHLKIALNHIVCTQQSQYGFIFMVRQQFPFLSQAHRINTMRFKHQNCNIRTNRNNHQRKEQIISTSQFCNQENAR